MMESVVRRIPIDGSVQDNDELLRREWLVTNGLGGYSTGTIAGVATRRYHGLLIAALPGNLGRYLMLAHATEQIRLPAGSVVRFNGEDRGPGELELFGAEYLTEFRLECGLPVWRYELGDIVIEKHVLMPYQHNTVHVTYRLVEGSETVRLKLMPTVAIRPHDNPVSSPLPHPFRLVVHEHRYELLAGYDLPPLRLTLDAERPAFTCEPQAIPEALFRIERSRGYESRGQLWTPGYFRADLTQDRPVTLVASTEPWEAIEALPPDAALKTECERRQRLLSEPCEPLRCGIGGQLVLAADQFIIRPSVRLDDETWAAAAGEDLRSVIAGYHWFTDWGRDTMISLEGLTMVTGRLREAASTLRTFAHYVRDGLIPNLFPEGEEEGLYHTADATLWYFHALDRYLHYSNDRGTLRYLLPTLRNIIEKHIKGTRFGIGMDPDDGLLRQGAEGYQLTWMDAKVGDWVVTPRRGKAVEINALWYNALRLLDRWISEEDEQHPWEEIGAIADRARESFNRRFWMPDRGYLYDVVDGEEGDDPSCRPNQVFAISLPNPVLDEQYWEPVMNVVQDRLLTPFGLRTLSPGDPNYKRRYDGDLRARDAAYHQGTVWAWLIGPFVDAWLKLNPENEAGACMLLEGLLQHMNDACIGSISEIFDAEEPYTPRGCIAQAWSVAEVLRVWARARKCQAEEAAKRSQETSAAR